MSKQTLDKDKSIASFEVNMPRCPLFETYKSKGHWSQAVAQVAGQLCE